MATTDSTKTKDESTNDDLIYDPKSGGYVDKYKSRDLYEIEKAAQNRQALTAGAAGLVGSIAQYQIAKQVGADPAIKAMGQEQARLQAQISKEADLVSDEEAAARRDAALAGAKRRAEQNQRRAEAIAASTGDVSVQTLIKAGEAGIGRIAQAGLEADARIAAENVARDQLKAKQDAAARDRIAGIEKTKMDIRNKLREKQGAIIQDLAEVVGLGLAYAPGDSIGEQIDDLREANVPDEEIAEIIKLAKKNPRKARKAIKEKMAKAKLTKTETEKVDAKAKAASETKAADAEKEVAKESSGTWTEGWAKYRLKEDGDIEYRDPDTNELKTVRKGTGAYNAIMALPTSPKNAEASAPAKEAATTKKAAPTEEAAPTEKAPTSSGIQANFAMDKKGNIYSGKDNGEDFFVQWNPTDKTFTIIDKDKNPQTDPLSVEDFKDDDPSEFTGRLYQLYTEIDESK